MNTPESKWTGLTPGVVIAIAAIMAGLYVIDRFLAKMEQQEIRKEATRLAGEGERLLVAKLAKQAVPRYQRAHSLVRNDEEYVLGYAKALLMAGDFERAEGTLRDFLYQRSNNAPANLLMARTMMALGRDEDVDSYYHRAIYGSWPSDAATTTRTTAC